MGVILERKKRILLNEPHIVTTTPAGIANFSTDLIAPLKSCKVEFLPVQSGSGDPSPNNVRPISGWTGLSLLQRNKNILDPSIRKDGGPVQTFGGDVRGSTNGDLILPAGTYTFSTNGPIANIAICKKEKKFVYFVADSTITFTLNETAEIEILYVEYDASYNYQLEVGSTATPYEPYSGSTIPIDWTSEAGTVYGGYVDLVTGELVTTYGLVTLYDTDVVSATIEGHNLRTYVTSGKLSTFASYKSGRCNKAVVLTSWGNVAGNGNAIGINNPSGNQFVINEALASTLQEAKDFIGADGLQIYTELATPITYQLTPTQLKSLRGVNNIWSDANGDTTVKYWTH